MDEELDSLIEGLEEAVYGLKGRTTDIRQQLPQLAQGPSPYTSVSPSGWLVSFPDDMYPSSQSFMGPVAIALVGHRDMTDEGFSGFMKKLHRDTYPRQIAEPAVAVEPGHLTDLRRLTRGGDYHPAMKYLTPASCYLMEDLVVLADGVLYNHLGHQGLSEYNRSGKIFSIGEVIQGLTTVAKSLVEPHSINRTVGDIVNRVDWPFSGGTVGTQRYL